MPTQTSSATTTKIALVVLLVALAFFLIYKFVLPKKTPSYKPFGGAPYIIVPGYRPPGYLPPGYKPPGYKTPGRK